jgi:hypothetical protein
MESTVKVPPQLAPKLMNLKKLGLSASQAAETLKDNYPSLTDQIILIPGDSSSAVSPASSLQSGALDHSGISRAVADGFALHHSRLEAARLEQERDEQIQARDAEFLDRVASLEDVVMGTAGGLASHLVQHQLQAQGKLEALDPGTSIKLMLTGLNAKQRDKIVENLAPELRQALEAAERGDTPALPSSTDEDDSQTIEVPQKKRGFLGFGA